MTILAVSLLAALQTFTFTRDGIGPIDVTTPVDHARIAKLFPKLSVKDTVDQQSEDADWPTVSVFQGGEELLQLSPCDAGPLGKICIVYSRSRSARTADGVRVGDPYPKVASKVKECSAGFEKEAGKVICHSVAAGNVLVLFGRAGVTKEGMPSDAELKKYRAVELRWLPPTPD